MEIVTDLHLHSKYSRAVSKRMDLAEMAKRAKIKGIDLLGTGDFTHPKWTSEIKESLEEKDGVLELKDKGEKKNKKDKKKIKFLLTTEISSIYKQGGKTRKIHNLIIAPSFAVVEKINGELKRRGCNISSDGRPIVGLSAKQVAELVFSVDQNCLLIPCHIWTPWFSLFGANSGFDTIEECFGEFSKNIYAVETGLSSDPSMNWRVADLDNRSIVSFSDAHSGEKLGREVTVLKIKDTKILRYEDIKGALIEKCEVRNGKLDNEVRVEISKNQDIPPQNPASHFQPHISYTIEFYPEEGKYHYAGHRKCGVSFSPQESKEKGLGCPVCGKKLTPGVLERVGQLGRLEEVSEEIESDGVRWIRRTTEEQEGQDMVNRPPFVKMVPLAEIIAQSFNVGVSSQKVKNAYENLTTNLGSELQILLRTKPEEISELVGEKVAEGVDKVRMGDIYVEPGFDGEFGKVRVWGLKDNKEKKNKKEKREQLGLKID